MASLAARCVLLALLVMEPAGLVAARRHVRRAAETSAPKKEAAAQDGPTGSAPASGATKGAKRRKGGKPARKPAPARRHARRRGKKQVDDEVDPITVKRVHLWERERNIAREDLKAQASAGEKSVPEAEPSGSRSATSQDFVRAAEDQATKQEPAHGVSLPGGEVPANSRRRGAEEENPAAPVPVVSLVRPVGKRPQLPPVEQEAATPEILPSLYNLYNKRGRLLVPAPLRGSREILLRQNLMANSEGLDRIQNDEAIDQMRQRRTLVGLPLSRELEVDERLAANRRFCRPWTAEFLRNLARAHYERFHTPLRVNSAVRTVEFQQRLQRTNGNAAPAEGDLASPHLTGQTIDLAKHGLSMTEIAWMRGYLLPLVQQSKVDVEEEFQQACFHVSVYRQYNHPGQIPRREVALAHSTGTSALAAAVP